MFLNCTEKLKWKVLRKSKRGLWLQKIASEKNAVNLVTLTFQVKV